MLHADNLPDLMTRDMFDDYCCDVCFATITLNTPVFYHALNISSTCDLCSECYATMHQHIRPRSSDDARYCDMCFGTQHDDFHHIGEMTENGTGIDACNECKNHLQDLFVPITATGPLHLIRTHRDMTLLCKPPSGCFIPNQIQNRISAALNDEYMEWMESVVRVPSFDFNVLEWTLISRFTLLPGCTTGCALALRCVEGSNQVASVVSDENDCVAFNIIYEDVDDFLREESAWRSDKGTDMDIHMEEDVLYALFAGGGSCDKNTIAAATGSFALFTRLDFDLSLDYAWAVD
jgi:hypothetical protein